MPAVTSAGPWAPTAGWLLPRSTVFLQQADGWLLHLPHREPSAFRTPSAGGRAFLAAWALSPSCTDCLPCVAGLPMLALSNSTSLELLPSWFPPCPSVTFSVTRHPLTEVLLSHICCIPVVRHNRGLITSKFHPLMLVLSGKTDGKSKAEGKRKISMNFEQSLAFPCVSISAVVTSPSHNFRNLGRVIDPGLEAPIQPTFGPGHLCHRA